MSQIPLAERRLLIVTGKGGTGKSTMAAALGLLAAARKRRTLIVTMDGAPEAHPAFTQATVERAATANLLAKDLYSTSIDTDRVLLEWLSAIGGKLPAKLLASRSSFRFFAAAAPGAKELLCLVRLMELSAGASEGAYDTVILDAPATGHALALLRAPATFSAIARVGPIAARAQELRELLAEKDSTALIAVTHAAEMSISETIELASAVQQSTDRTLDLAIVNATSPRRFSGPELQRAQLLAGDPAIDAALAAAQMLHERSLREQAQIRRLRAIGLASVSVPYAFQGTIGEAELQGIRARLGRSRRL